MIDRELLMLAAKAAGINPPMTLYPDGEVSFSMDVGFKAASGIGAGVDVRGWNPLEDDGDALRLAVALGLTVICDHNNSDACCVSTSDGAISVEEFSGLFGEFVGDGVVERDFVTTRRAIVRAAAEIGKGMP